MNKVSVATIGFTIALLGASIAPAQGVKIQARWNQVSFFPREPVRLSLTVSNLSKQSISIDDPRSAGSTLRFLMTFPDGAEKEFPIASLYRAPGVPSIPLKMKLPPGRPQELPLEITSLLPKPLMGTCCLQIQWEWKKGELWKSAQQSLIFHKPAGVFLEVLASESSGEGMQHLVWGEDSSGSWQLLMADIIALESERPLLQEVSRIGILPREIRPVFSVTPPRTPYPAKWIFWIEKQLLYAQFYNPNVPIRPQPFGQPIPRVPLRMISPALLSQTANSGKPGSFLAILVKTGNAEALLPAEISPAGIARFLPILPAQGKLQSAWIISSAENLNHLIWISQSAGKRSLYYSICQRKTICSPPRNLLTLPDTFTLGNVSLNPAGKIRFGMVEQRPAGWWFTEMIIGATREMAESETKWPELMQEAEPLKLKWNTTGKPVLIFAKGRELYCTSSGGKSVPLACPLEKTSPLWDFFIQPDSSKWLAYYDFKTGPILLRIP